MAEDAGLTGREVAASLALSDSDDAADDATSDEAGDGVRGRFF